MGESGTITLGKVCVLLNGKPSLEDQLNALAAEAADRISTTPQAKARLHALFVWYMNRAAELAQEKE